MKKEAQMYASILCAFFSSIYSAKQICKNVANNTCFVVNLNGHLEKKETQDIIKIYLVFFCAQLAQEEFVNKLLTMKDKDFISKGGYHDLAERIREV